MVHWQIGLLPLWGGVAAAFLAAWAAYARRKRLQHAIEEARERAARAARLAAQRLKAAALIAAVARDLARRNQGQGKDDDKGEDPPRPRRVSLTIDGEVPLEEAAEGRTPQPGPPRPDGGHAHSQPVDIAKWKQADYGQIAHAREVAEQWQRAQEIAHPPLIPVCRAPEPGETCAELYWNPQTREFKLPPLPSQAWSRPYTTEEWQHFHRQQDGTDDCNAFALAMAHNLLYADQPERWLEGNEVQARLEQSWGVAPASFLARAAWEVKPFWWVPPYWVPDKLPKAGIPTWQYDNAVHQILPDAKVEHLTGATTEDLKRAIAEGKIVIVAVGWDSNWGIVWKFVNSKLDKWRGKPDPQQPSTIGHYMVVVGYNSQQVYLLNPGEAEALDERTWEWFQKYWQRGNLFIEPGSMWILDRENKP